MQYDFVFSGFGGQGVMFVGQLLAYAAMDADLHVTWIPSYGPEMRGGTAHCFVMISDHEIGSPVVSRPKIGVMFNLPSFNKYEPILAPDGMMVVNSSLVNVQSTRTDLHTLYVPATEIAEAIGSPKITNLVLLGAMLDMVGVLPVSVVETALENHGPAHRRNLLEANFRALEAGAKYASEVLQPNR